MARTSQTEQIVLAQYDAGWPSTYTVECRRLATALAPYGLVGVEHVGSTAIPGMIAKPIVDIMAGVTELKRLPTPRDPFRKRLDYEWGHAEDEPDWLYFIKRDDEGRRRVHLHVVPYEGDFWTRTLRFRDALREDSKLMREYGELKTRLAKEFRHDRRRYVDAKTQFVSRVIAR